MIKSLQIRNYAIIEELEIRFSEGLTIITGETGAGKSILLGALGLIMGERADTKALYHLDQKCVVEALFDIRKYRLQDFFQENDIDYDNELVIRREILPSGKSRAFINDTPVNLRELQQLSGALIDLHQQFDTLDIHQVSFQLRMLDALAGHRTELEAYQQGYAEYQRLKHQLESLQEADRQAMREIDFLQFQYNELSAAALREGEQDELESELDQLANAEEIKRVLSNLYQGLSGEEQAVISQLEEMAVSLNSVRKFHPALESLHQRLQGAIYELQDMAEEFERIGESTEYDGERIVEVQQRLDVLYRLQNKHQVSSIGELLEIQQRLEGQLQTYGDRSDEIDAIQARLDVLEKSLQERAAGLSERRREVVPGFQKNVLSLLEQLSMEHAQLQIQVRPTRTLTSTGTDEVEFLFAANKGGRLLPMKDVASGGELSRLTLVTKSLVASAIPLPTLIFDEIDTGISGDVALKMGNILRGLSDQHQVVSITHSPQVASKANTHYFVFKQIKDERTVTRVRSLSQEERIRAIATMLSQNPPSDSAIENAKELLGVA